MNGVASEPGDGLWTRCRAGWQTFWFEPVPPMALHTIRLLAGLVLLGWLLALGSEAPALFSLRGWFDDQAYIEVAQLSDSVPSAFRWSAVFLCGDSATRFALFYWSGFAGVLLFTLGVWTRLTGVLTWVLVVSLTVNPVLEYEGDIWLSIIVFYLMVGYLLLGWRDGNLSWNERLLGSRACFLLGRADAGPATSVAANLALRMLQVHAALVVVAGGLHKLQFGDWWAGVALWYLWYPPLQTTIAEARAFASSATQLLFVISLAAYLILAWQLTFPLFAWRRGMRFLLLGGAFVGGLGAAYLYQLPWLGPTFFVVCLSFLTPSEWQLAWSRLRQFLSGLASPTSAVEAAATTEGSR